MYATGLNVENGCFITSYDGTAKIDNKILYDPSNDKAYRNPFFPS